MKISCQRVVQNNVEFFIGKLCFSDLSKICAVNQRIILGFDENELPIYNDSFQRKVNTGRSNQIKDYLLIDEEATFPNSIILSIPSLLLAAEIKDGEFSEIDIDENKIILNSSENPIYVQIIDGQHRFSGMKEAVYQLQGEGNNDPLLNRLLEFEFVVSFFVDAQIEFQAMLFSTINRTPVKVPYDIVYDLFGLVDKDSPQKTALAICLELNSSKKGENGLISPFNKRIKLLGKKEKGESSYISQQMFIRTIITLISPSIRVSETERFKDRTYFNNGGNYRTIFRSFYASSHDNYIFRTIINFFYAVENTFVDSKGNSYWKMTETSDNPLQRTIGFLSLIDVLVELFHKGIVENKLSVIFFKENLAKAASIRLLDANNESLYPYTSKGKTQLTKDLLDLIA